MRLDRSNVVELFRGYDVIVDGTDNFNTRFLVNDAAVWENKPLVHGAILRFEGQATTIVPGEGHCYRCIFREPPPPGSVPNCQQAGVLGAIAGIVGAVQATEAVKLITGKGEPLVGRILIIDALGMSFRTFKAARDPKCPVCGDEPTITEFVDYAEVCGFDQNANGQGATPV